MQTKKNIRSCTALLILVLTLSLLFSSCSSLHTVTFDKTNDSYFDKKTQTTYTPLSASYEPISRGEEYGKVKIAGMTSVLYTITGVDPTRFLCTVYGDVFCRADLTVPPLAEWTVTELTVCLNDTIAGATLTLRSSEEQQNVIITELLQAYCDGVPVRYPVEDIVASYIVRFVSPDVPGIYYAVRYYEYGEDIWDTVKNEDGTETDVNFGRYFIYDRYEGRCVAVSDALHHLLEGDGK